MIIENGKTLKFERTFQVPAAKVFEAWSKPAVFQTWWKDITLAEMDFRVGGKYRLEWADIPGDYAIGEYLDIVPNQKIVFTWNTTGLCNGKPDYKIKDTRITLLFAANGPEACAFTLTHEFLPTESDVDSHDQGWTYAMRDMDRQFNAPLRANAEPLRIELKRTFNASPEKLFEAWSNPKYLNQWFNRTGATLGKATADFKVGGFYRMDYTDENNVILPHEGRYLEIVPAKKIVFTWMSDNCHVESKVTVTLLPVDAKSTELTLVHEGLYASEASHRGHQEGWMSCLTSIEEELPSFR